ncbi:hypothetical protein RI129_010689 [Pyrocoelia pectoralis]|uniref:Ig-like domain-containing protein n=1 Tax=Pyrocoelia pectoralis TaxID=417401 RepID=A0AAN7ZI64_9COLE
MWHIFVLFLSAIFAKAIVWAVEPELSILLHEGAKVRNVSSHLNVEEGTTFTLTCTSKPHQLSATDDLVWQEIGSHSRTTSNGISFEPIRMEDDGEYLCVDKKGNTYKSVKINVQPKEKPNHRHHTGNAPSLEELYKQAQKLAHAEKNNPQSKNWDALINIMLGVIEKNENLIENLTAIALEELKGIEKPKSEEPAKPGHVQLSPKSGGVGKKQKNFVKLTLSPADEDFLHEKEEGNVNSNHLVSPTTEEVATEETETTTESLKEEGETEEEATTTEASSEEYYDEEDEEYSEEEEEEENEKEKDENKNNEEEEEEEEEEGSETEEPSSENEETTKNPESAESKEIVFPDNGPNKVFNRYGGGLNAIYTDYFEQPSNNENGEEEETATVKETPTLDSHLLNKLKPYLNKHMGRKRPTEMPSSSESSSSSSEEPMQLAVNEINNEVKDMAVFKYIVGVILLILVILLLAFIIRIWHLLEFKVSHDSPLPPQKYVPLVSSTDHEEVDDATETLLP